VHFIKRYRAFYQKILCFSSKGLVLFKPSFLLPVEIILSQEDNGLKPVVGGVGTSINPGLKAGAMEFIPKQAFFQQECLFSPASVTPAFRPGVKRSHPKKSGALAPFLTIRRQKNTNL